jgi:hypothetical protein
MEWDDVLKVLEKLGKSNLTDTVLWILFLSRAVIIPGFRRLSGVSAYIKRLLAIQRRHAKGQERLARAVESLCRRSDVRRKLSATPTGKVLEVLGFEVRRRDRRFPKSP